MKKIFRSIIFLSVASVLFLNIQFAFAQPMQGPTQSGQTLDKQYVTILGQQINTGSLDGFAQLAVAVSKWILGLTGSASLLMFVYGGVMFLISAGSSQKVEKAKQIIVGAVIGLVIVFASYTIIGFAISTMGVKVNTGEWASSGWFKK